MIDFDELENILISLKKNHHIIFATTLCDRLFIWRLITPAEYNLISKSSAGDKYTFEEQICQLAVLYPSDIIFSNWKAGVPTVLAEQIIKESGFGGDYKKVYMLFDYREKCANSDMKQAQIVIASAFPQYKFEEIEEWNLEKLMDMLARAEWKLQQIDNIDFKFETVLDNPEEEQEEEEIDFKTKLKEIETDIIKNGGDPIFELYSIYHKHKPYVEFPFIIGLNWDNEEVNKLVQQKLYNKK